MKNLSVFLPTRNRPYLLEKTISSFLKLKLENSQIVVIDNNTDLIEHKRGEEYSIKNIVEKFKQNSNVKFYLADRILDWEEQFNIYLNLSKEFKYFNMISDDDFFLKNNGINKKINFLNQNEDFSFAVSSAVMFELTETKFWKRRFINNDLSLEGTDFIDLFIDNEALQHTTITGIFRIKNMIKSDCFKVLEIIKYNKLQAGYGLDSRIFFRNINFGNVKIFGNFITRVIRFHEGGMTYNQPVESSYCYYWSIIDSLNYLNLNDIKIKNQNKYLQQWIQNLLTSNLINTYLKNDEKNFNKIKEIIGGDFLGYILKEMEKLEIPRNESIEKYIKMNKFLNKVPRFLIRKTDKHIIPSSYKKIFININLFYYLIIFTIGVLLII